MNQLAPPTPPSADGPKGPRGARPHDLEAERDEQLLERLIDGEPAPVGSAGGGPARGAAVGRGAGTAPESARAAALRRFVAAARAALPEPVEPGLAERLALRVRDQVALEERTAQRLEHAPRGWRRFSARTRIRLVLASVAVHVAVLGWVVLRDRPHPLEEGGRVVNIGRAEPSPELLPREPEAPYELGPVLLAEQIPDALLERHGLAGTEEALSPEPWPPEVRVAEHPAGVGLDMLRRTRATVKSRRLQRLGLDAGGTLAAVQSGLKALTARQEADGSFAPDLTLAPGSRAALTEVGRAALALLPFLAEGRSSAGAAGVPGEPVVERGLSFVRTRLAASKRPSGALPSDGLPADDLALSLLALSEDYMLAYGSWTPGLARERAVELQDLTTRLVAMQQADGGFSAQALEAPLWPLLALDAAAHTGVAVPSASSRERLVGWFAALPRASDGLPAGPDGRPDLLLAAGEALLARVGAASVTAGSEGLRTLVASVPDMAETPATGIVAGLALYRRDPAAFRDLGRRQGAALLARLGESGTARRGDAVTDTALLLLALQAAYRVY